MIRIRNVKPLDRFRVRIELSNGKKKTVDLKPFLHGPIFEPLRRNSTLFRKMKVDAELGTIVWENGADIDPDVLVGSEMPDRFRKTRRIQLQDSPPKSLALKETKTRYRIHKRKK